MTPRNPADTRGRILAAATRLFYRQGIRAVPMDGVAEEAGVTKRTLYYHFDSKDDLVVAYLRHVSDRVRGAHLDAATRRGHGPRERLLAVFDDLEERFQHEKFRGCPFINAAAELADSEPARAAAATHKEGVRKWFEGSLVELGVPDPEALSEQLMLLTDGAISTWLVRRDPRAARWARAAAAVLIDLAGGHPDPTTREETH